MGDSRPLRMAETFPQELLWFEEEPAAGIFYVLRLLCLSPMLPGMDWELVFSWLFLIFIVFAIVFEAWQLSRYGRLLMCSVLFLLVFAASSGFFMGSSELYLDGMDILRAIWPIRAIVWLAFCIYILRKAGGSLIRWIKSKRSSNP